MASVTRHLDASIKSGLSLNINTQNSIWFNAPSQSKSPSLIIDLTSSSVRSPRPSTAAALRRRLSNVMTPFSRSINSSNPLQSSPIRPSPPSFPAIAGRKSWKVGSVFCWVGLVGEFGEAILKSWSFEDCFVWEDCLLKVYFFLCVCCVICLEIWI